MPMNETPKMLDDNQEVAVDKFEISFRILGNEFFGTEISSESKAKNWAFFGLITLVAITVLVNNIGPGLIAMINSIAGG
jgi:hypothetical protein